MARPFDPATERRRQEHDSRDPDDGARWLARIVLLALIVIGLLYIMNNTHGGLVFKCHVLGDLGACLLGGA
jgi:hypothetical protein